VRRERGEDRGEKRCEKRGERGGKIEEREEGYERQQSWVRRGEETDILGVAQRSLR
jgi:hypothetical protein